VGYVHHSLSIHCSSSASSSFSFSSSSSSRSDPVWTISDQLWWTCWRAHSICPVVIITTRQGHLSMSVIGIRFPALLLLHLFFLFLPGWPHSIFLRSTQIVSPVGVIDSAHGVHSGWAMILGYVHFWPSVCCSTPTPAHAPRPPVLPLPDWSRAGVCVGP